MSTRKTWAHEMAARAKAVGWKVTAPRGIAGAYKVVMGPCHNEQCNHMMQIHLTSSDINAQKTVEREFNAHGFAGLEKRLELAKANQRATRLEEDRRANERAIAKVQKASTALNRASGPYAGPEEVDSAWFTTLHPAPTFRWVLMSPEQAEWILKNLNTDNRPLREATIEHYANVIRSGQWHQTHQGMAIDQRGILQDGQHRLAGIARADKTVPVAFFAGMPPENFKAIDEGLLRTAGQLFGKLGESNASAIAAIIKLARVFNGPNPRTFLRARMTNETIVDGFAGEEDEIRRAAVYATRHYKHAHCSPAALGTAYYLIRKANGPDNPYVAAFFRGLVTARKLDTRLALEVSDPRLRVREHNVNARAKNKRTNALDQLSLIVLAWNYVIEGKRIQHIRFTDAMAVPRINLLPYGEHVRSACPELLEGEVEDDLLAFAA